MKASDIIVWRPIFSPESGLGKNIKRTVVVRLGSTAGVLNVILLFTLKHTYVKATDSVKTCEATSNVLESAIWIIIVQQSFGALHLVCKI